MSLSAHDTDLRTLSHLLGIVITPAELPYELIWKGIYELEIASSNGRLVLVGILAAGLPPDDPLLTAVTGKRTREFGHDRVFLAFQNDSGRLILWTELTPGGSGDLYAEHLRMLLEEMDHLRPVLPSL